MNYPTLPMSHQAIGHSDKARNNIDYKTATLGSPIANTTVQIVDSNNNPVPKRVIGQIMVKGPSISPGYCNEPLITSNTLLTTTDGINQRTCFTGDLGYMDKSNTIHFIARLDRQIKVNGIRIESQEIEAYLHDHILVDQALINVNQQSNKSPEKSSQLYAFIILNPNVTTPTSITDELKAHLKQFLSSSLIPAHFVYVEYFPLLPSGKIDWLTLQQHFSQVAEVRSDLNNKLAVLWEQVIGVVPSKTTDHFFELGGDSFAILQLLIAIRNH